MDKFSYYDTLGTLVPGLFLIWALPILGPVSPDTVKSTLTGSSIADAVIILAVSYVAGHVLQFFSRYSIEPIIKRAFWKGEMFSKIFLVKVFSRCPEGERIRFLDQAKIKLAYTDAALQPLDDFEASKKGAKRAKALEVSDAIYRALDAKTLDSSLALKAHTQNTMYSLFRNLSAACLLLAVVNSLVAVGFVHGKVQSHLIIGLDAFLALVFLLRARQRGELYVKGLFWSYL
jgi:hypothetical protein